MPGTDRTRLAAAVTVEWFVKESKNGAAVL
jgi:hypothetical protein